MKTRIFSQSASAVALCCSLSQGAVAQLSLSLEQAQTLGVEQAYAMQRARIDVEVARRDVKELLATGLPQVNASFDFNHFLDIPTQVAPASQLDPSLPEDLVLPLSSLGPPKPCDGGPQCQSIGVQWQLPRGVEGLASVCRCEGFGRGCHGSGDPTSRGGSLCDGPWRRRPTSKRWTVPWPW